MTFCYSRDPSFVVFPLSSYIFYPSLSPLFPSSCFMLIFGNSLPISFDPSSCYMLITPPLLFLPRLSSFFFLYTHTICCNGNIIIYEPHTLDQVNISMQRSTIINCYPRIMAPSFVCIIMRPNYVT